MGLCCLFATTNINIVIQRHELVPSWLLSLRAAFPIRKKEELITMLFQFWILENVPIYVITKRIENHKHLEKDHFPLFSKRQKTETIYKNSITSIRMQRCKRKPFHLFVSSWIKHYAKMFFFFKKISSRNTNLLFYGRTKHIRTIFKIPLIMEKFLKLIYFGETIKE